MRQNYTFHRGIIDKDTDPRLVEPGKLLDVKNARMDGGKMIKEAGMLDLAAVLQSGYDLVGSALYKDVVYIFSTNGSLNRIDKYDISAETLTNLITTTQLSLDADYPILDVDFIEDEANDRLLMYWVDGLNEPRYLNITFAETEPDGFYTTTTAFSVIKAPPRKEPEIAFLNNPEVRNNKLINKCFRFGVRYIYRDGQKSSVSCFSIPNVIPVFSLSDQDDVGIVTSFFNGVLIKHEVYDVHHPGVDDVTNNSIESVEFIAWEVNTSVMFRITKFTEGVKNGNVLEYEFYNNEIYPVLGEDSFVSYSSVPKIARKQWLAENVLVYGDYTDGYANDITTSMSVTSVLSSVFGTTTGGTLIDSTTLDFDVATIGPIAKYSKLFFALTGAYDTVSYSGGFNIVVIAQDDYTDILDMFTSTESQYYTDILESQGITHGSSGPGLFTLYATGLITFVSGGVSVSNDLGMLSLKANNVYQYGILYMDNFNRRGDIELFPELKIEEPTLLFGEKPKITISHTPPSWAKKFKIVRKEYIYGFENVTFDSANVYENKIWLEINEDYYDRIPDTAKFISLPTFSYGGSKFQSPIDKVVITDSGHSLGAGKFIVIKDTQYDLFNKNDITGGVDQFTSTTFEVDLGTNITTETYREYPETFFIQNGYHTSDFKISGDQDQTVSQPFIKTLAFDGDIWYTYDPTKLRYLNGYLLDVGKYYSPLGRAHLDADEFKEQRRKNSITYSTDTYVQDSGANGLSTFDLGQVNYKDYDIRYGQVQKIYGRDTDLIVFQEDKVHFQPFNKNLLQAVTGDNTVVTSDKILGTHTSYVGEYGMSHPESFAFRDKTLFWVDAKRGVIMRLDVNGLYPISRNGLEDYWHSFFINTIPTNMFACFDATNMEYLLYNGNIVWAYSLNDQGWSRYMEYAPIRYIYDGVNTYSFYGDTLYKHYAGTINNYYGTVVDSVFQFAANKAFSDKKIASAVYLEGSSWDMKIEDTESRFTTIDSYEDKEGFLYAGVPMIESVSASQAIGGIGSCSDVSQIATTTTMTVPLIPDGLSIGDEIYTSDVLIGTLTGISQNILTLNGVGTVNNGNFVYYKKNSKLEGAPMRDHIFLVTMTNEGSLYADLFAVNLEIIKSNS